MGSVIPTVPIDLNETVNLSKIIGRFDISIVPNFQSKTVCQGSIMMDDGVNMNSEI